MIRGITRFLPVLGIAIVTGILYIAASFALVVVSGFFYLLGIWLVLLAALIPPLIIMTILWVAIPVAVIERGGVGHGVMRSFDLTSGYRWKVFEIVAIVVVVEFVVNLVAGFIFSGAVGSRAFIIFNLVFAAAMAVFSGVVTTVSYHQLRLAKEGVDVRQIAAVFD